MALVAGRLPGADLRVIGIGDETATLSLEVAAG